MSNTPQIRFAGFTDAWEQRKLGDYVTITSGEAPSKFEIGDELYIKVDDLNYTAKYMVDSQNKVALHKSIGKVSKGSVVFPKRGAAIMTNKVRILAEDSYMDTNMMALTSTEIDSEFLYNIILNEGLYKIADTSTIPQINNKHIEPYEIMLPEFDEQRMIGEYFRNLDSLITLHQRKCDALQKFKKSMLQKMFPQNGESVPEIRFAGFTDAWEQRKLGDIGETYTGLSGKTKEDFGHGDAKFVTYMNVFSNSIADSAMTESVEIDKKQNEVKYGDVFFTTSSETPDEVGMSSVWLENSENTYLNSFCFGYRPSENINPYYMAYMLRSENVRKSIIFLAQGISRYNISKNKMMEISVPLPNLDEQQKIGDYFHDLDTLITLHQRKLETLQKMKKSLLQKMFV
ncbi:MAG: restriction endonuclease subunit S [Ruminococcus sp.]|nr:restriction endonuclease subunit S [Ruminococcus sp.]